MVKADLITSILLVVFGIAIVAISAQMPTMADRNQSIYSAPGVVPGFIGVMLILLSLAMLFRSIRKKAIQEFRGGVIPKDVLAQESTRRILMTIALCAVYSFLLGKIWFPLVTFVFIFAFILLFEYDWKAAFSTQTRKVIVAAIIGLATTALVTLVFQKLFLVNLP
ncbi:MAG: tripartite tricarboxylate transporter TctB family protein, partial [Rectinemataceae bacterium]|nr:tripartite tricarboxylate transporter TctB family protein [Rectinemataceae bacterium]